MPETSVSNSLRRPRTARQSSEGAAEPTSASELDTSYLETLLGYNARRAALSVISVFLQRMEPYGLRPVDFSEIGRAHV